MIGHELHRGGSFWSFLLSIDKDLADSARLALGERDRTFELAESIVRHSLEYLTPLRFPTLSWIPAKQEGPVEGCDLDLLLQRLTWPSSLVRERACAGIATLLRHARVSASVAARLAAWASRQEADSVQALAILICCHAGHAVPGSGTENDPQVKLGGLRRSVLAELLCERLPPSVEVSFGNRPAHSADPPSDFTPSDFFIEHVRHFLPPLFFMRARAAERLGTENLVRQWAYEWQLLQLAQGLPLSTAALNYWLSSSAHKQPCRAADPAMSEVFRSAYLRAIAWAVERQLMPPEGARLLAGETCPVDLELCKIPPGRRPRWWPTIEPGDRSDDSAVREILGRVNELHAVAMRGDGPWEEGWIPAQGSGRVFAADAVYDLDFVAFLQACTGPTTPPAKEVSRLLHNDFLFPGRFAWTEHELSFRGVIRRIDLEGTLAQLYDWKILPLCGKSWAPYPVRWQWWRLHRMVCRIRSISVYLITAVSPPHRAMPLAPARRRSSRSQRQAV